MEGSSSGPVNQDPDNRFQVILCTRNEGHERRIRCDYAIFSRSSEKSTKSKAISQKDKVGAPTNTVLAELY